jgi:membrane-bound metal-dependent hydrolase YbcI (DUF457 family)
MNKNTHIAAGVLTSIGIVYAGGSLELIPGIMIGSVLPDLDANHSYIRSKVKIIAKIYDFLPNNLVFQHRGLLLHSAWTIALFSYLNVKYGTIFGGIAIGCLSHHLLDMLTSQGLKKYFWPICAKK